MISVHEAEKLILESAQKRPRKKIKIDELREEVCCEPLIADRPNPPFDRVAMDGIAVSLNAWKKGRRSFLIEDCQKAGEPKKKLGHEDHCLEVMTGAPLPYGTDAVIRYEDTQIDLKNANVKEDLSVKEMQNVHLCGEDYKEGDILLAAYSVMTAPRWAVAASIGKAEVEISERPKISVVSTGDEIVDVKESPKDFQIRRSNSYAILASLREFGFQEVRLENLKDQKKEIYERLQTLLSENDVVILSGGVSMGKYDFIPECLADLQVRKIFHKVKQKPGKPLWFGMNESNKVVFGLPGNPVSAVICLHRYVLPYLQASIGREPRGVKIFALLNESFTFKKNLTCFLPVKVQFSSQGVLSANPVRSNGSGDFSSLIHSDGFLELPEEKSFFEKGEAYPLYLWKGVL